MAASMIFSDEEARFLRLLLRMADHPIDDRSSWLRLPERRLKPAGELRILVLGAKGVGKTSLLTKICTGIFPDATKLAASAYTHGCRHTITIEKEIYKIDALELPALHLAEPAQIAQALAITDAAVLVYDITNPSSLTHLKSLANTIRAALHPSSRPKKRIVGFPFANTSPEIPTQSQQQQHRPYHFLLLGAKNDVAPHLRLVPWLEGHNATNEFFGPQGVAAGASAGFLEVSARSGENVGAVFTLLGREVLRSRRETREEREESARKRAAMRTMRNSADDGLLDGGGGVFKRRWCALKATLSRGSIFRKNGEK